jgi:hypothetical protein
MLGYFVNLASKTKKLPIIPVQLTPENNIDPEEPDYDQVQQLIDTALVPPHSESPAP